LNLLVRPKDKPLRVQGLHQEAGEAIRTPDIHVGYVTVGYFMQAVLTKRGVYGTMRGETLLKKPRFYYQFLLVKCVEITNFITINLIVRVNFRVTSHI